MNYYSSVSTEMSYLSQFYTEAELDSYAKGNDDKIQQLYAKTQPKKVSIASLKGNSFTTNTVLVSSPDGWVPVTDCIEKTKNEMYICTFASGKRIEASHDHLYQKTDGTWHYTKDLVNGDEILSSNGNKSDTIISLVQYNKDTKVYDLSVNHNNHRYYTDTICSHNSGKSLFMQNLAVNWAMQGMNGCYLTLELSEGLCAMRMDSMMTNTSSKEIFRDIDNVEMKVKLAGKKAGHLRIKYMPAQSTVNDIRAYMKELEIQTGKKPDFLCVDYLDLLMPVSAKVSPNDLFVKDKYVSEELRNLAKELDIIFVTASQLNRCLKLDTVIEANGKKIQIKDVQVGDYLTSNEGPVQVHEVLPITKQHVFKITTKSGKEIVCSPKHKFPTTNGISTLDSGLKVGDKLQSLRSRDK